jgi:hypothetical protein
MGSQSVTKTACGKGYYNYNEGRTSCYSCSGGYECDGAINAVICDYGEWAPSLGLYCVACPAGYSCDRSSSTSACSSTQWSLTDWRVCDNCPQGVICNSQKQMPIVCPQGYYAGSTGSTSCTKILSGSFANTYPEYSSNSCASNYVSYDGMAFCFPCPIGYSCSTLDANAMVRCTEDQYNSGTAACGKYQFSLAFL